MARDVMRHRLVLSFEALSDNVDRRRHPGRGPAPRPRPRRPAPRTCARREPAAAERLLQRLDWQVLRKLDGLLQGEYRSLFRGPGVDLATLREYQPGDDVRYIDWNVTARLTTPYVREYHEDREITAWFLLDLSPSVDFGTADDGRRKREVLIEFVTTLARVLTRRGNRIGAIVYGRRVERTIPAGTGRLQVLRLVDDLLRQPIYARAPATNLAELLEAAPRDDQATLVRGDRVRLHQRARAGSGPCTSWRDGTSCWRSGSSTRASRRCRTSGGSCSRTPRPASSSKWTPATGRSASGSRWRRGSARRRSPPRSGGRASTQRRSRPTTTWCARSCGWRCGDGSGNGPRLPHDVPLAGDAGGPRADPVGDLLALRIERGRRRNVAALVGPRGGRLPVGGLGRGASARAAGLGCLPAAWSWPASSSSSSGWRGPRPRSRCRASRAPSCSRSMSRGAWPPTTWRRPGSTRPRRSPGRWSSGSRRASSSGSSRSVMRASRCSTRRARRPRC